MSISAVSTRLAVTWMVVALATGCSRSNNLLLGRVGAELGTHRVVVTDCYRLAVPPPRIEEGQDGRPAYRFKPCRDADVVIRGAALFVNGILYGQLRRRDAVLVDHGVVSIQHHAPAGASGMEEKAR